MTVKRETPVGIGEWKDMREPHFNPFTIQEPLYTTAQRKRRDESPWTVVQALLAPLQFVVFLVSTVLVLRFLQTGEGFEAATASVFVKTLVLYAIMVTGSIWEKQVFGRYLFAPAFYYEDAVSMVVIALHTIYLVSFFAAWPAESQMLLALAAYAAYVVNAAQFLLKLRVARVQDHARQLRLARPMRVSHAAAAAHASVRGGGLPA